MLIRPVCLLGALAILGCSGGGDGFPTGADDSGSGPGPTGKPDGQAQGADAAPAPGDDAATGPTTVGNYGPKDMPKFTTAAELCAYVNTEREGYVPHDRFRGPPWVGQYHQTVTWPVDLTVDATLSASALAMAKSLAGGAAPQGSPYSDGQPAIHNYLYVNGVDTSSYTIASQEQPGDWTSDIAGNYRAGITSANGTARQGLFYHDPGGQGPVLTHIGCGGAQTPGGSSWWWVVQLGL